MGAYESQICHYCGGHATTDDHVVPRSILPRPQSRLPYWFRAHNVVPACKDCNGLKANFKSDCECETCRWAWSTALAVPFIVAPNYVPRVRKVLKAALEETPATPLTA